MSHKSEIYSAYYDKWATHNRSVGGEPDVESYLSPKQVAEIEALPRSNSWGHPTGSRGYQRPDGSVVELRRTFGVQHFTRYALVFKSEAHHRGYHEIMGFTQYFEG